MSDDKVNKVLDRNAVQEQFPLRTAGTAGQNAFVGQHKVFFSGSTGLVATSYGLPGVTVGRLRTGVYGIRFPRWKEVSCDVQLCTPTGVDYISSVGGMSGVGNIVGVSGGMELRISSIQNTPIASGGYTPSGTRVPTNPATGTVANLMFFVNPVTQY
jgi:hypothetical protein